MSSISTMRAQLINKGIIYPIRYRELDFTVPEFSGFIQRLEEYQKWCADGRKYGMEQKLLDQIQKEIIKGKSLEQIAEYLEESMDTIQPLYEQLIQEK